MPKSYHKLSVFIEHFIILDIDSFSAISLDFSEQLIDELFQSYFSLLGNGLICNTWPWFVKILKKLFKHKHINNFLLMFLWIIFQLKRIIMTFMDWVFSLFLLLSISLHINQVEWNLGLLVISSIFKYLHVLNKIFKRNLWKY